MPNTTTVAGPLKTQAAATTTAEYLGAANHSTYSRAVKDADGFDTDERQYFVERLNDVVPTTILGLPWEQIQRMQRGHRV